MHWIEYRCKFIQTPGLSIQSTSSLQLLLLVAKSWLWGGPGDIYLLWDNSTPGQQLGESFRQQHIVLAFHIRRNILAGLREN